MNEKMNIMIENEAAQYSDLMVIIKKLTNDGRIALLHESLYQIFTTESEFTINELIQIYQPQKDNIDINQLYRLNSQIFKNNLKLIINIMIDQVHSSLSTKLEKIISIPKNHFQSLESRRSKVQSEVQQLTQSLKPLAQPQQQHMQVVHDSLAISQTESNRILPDDMGLHYLQFKNYNIKDQIPLPAPTSVQSNSSNPSLQTGYSKIHKSKDVQISTSFSSGPMGKTHSPHNIIFSGYPGVNVSNNSIATTPVGAADGSRESSQNQFSKMNVENLNRNMAHLTSLMPELENLGASSMMKPPSLFGASERTNMAFQYEIDSGRKIHQEPTNYSSGLCHRKTQSIDDELLFHNQMSSTNSRGRPLNYFESLQVSRHNSAEKLTLKTDSTFKTKENMKYIADFRTPSHTSSANTSSSNMAGNHFVRRNSSAIKKSNHVSQSSQSISGNTNSNIINTLISQPYNNNFSSNNINNNNSNLNLTQKAQKVVQIRSIVNNIINNKDLLKQIQTSPVQEGPLKNQDFNSTLNLRTGYNFFAQNNSPNGQIDFSRDQRGKDNYGLQYSKNVLQSSQSLKV